LRSDTVTARLENDLSPMRFAKEMREVASVLIGRQERDDDLSGAAALAS
jgi:hypothetical protein